MENDSNSQRYYQGQGTCGYLDVPNDAPAGIVEEFDTALDAPTLRPSPTEHLEHLGELDWVFSVHICCGKKEIF